MNAEASTGLLHSSERVTEQTMPLWLTDLPQWPTRDHDDAVLDARRALRMRGTASIPVLQRVLDGLRALAAHRCAQCRIEPVTRPDRLAS